MRTDIVWALHFFRALYSGSLGLVFGPINELNWEPPPSTASNKTILIYKAKRSTVIIGVNFVSIHQDNSLEKTTAAENIRET